MSGNVRSHTHTTDLLKCFSDAATELKCKVSAIDVNSMPVYSTYHYYTINNRPAATMPCDQSWIHPLFHFCVTVVFVLLIARVAVDQQGKHRAFLVEVEGWGNIICNGNRNRIRVPHRFTPGSPSRPINSCRQIHQVFFNSFFRGGT